MVKTPAEVQTVSEWGFNNFLWLLFPDRLLGVLQKLLLQWDFLPQLSLSFRVWSEKEKMSSEDMEALFMPEVTLCCLELIGRQHNTNNHSLQQRSAKGHL